MYLINIMYCIKSTARDRYEVFQNRKKNQTIDFKIPSPELSILLKLITLTRMQSLNVTITVCFQLNENTVSVMENYYLIVIFIDENLFLQS